jgi:hypothetical protein
MRRWRNPLGYTRSRVQETVPQDATPVADDSLLIGGFNLLIGGNQVLAR